MEILASQEEADAAVAVSLFKVPNCFSHAIAVLLNWILSLVWIHAQLPNRIRMHEIQQYRSGS
jgi:hypothetical protein